MINELKNVLYHIMNKIINFFYHLSYRWWIWLVSCYCLHDYVAVLSSKCSRCHTSIHQQILQSFLFCLRMEVSFKQKKSMMNSLYCINIEGRTHRDYHPQPKTPPSLDSWSNYWFLQQNHLYRGEDTPGFPPPT